MGFNQAAPVLVLLVVASLLAVSNANANADANTKIVVGGSEKWHFGFNYTNWAIKHGEFYINDALG